MQISKIRGERSVAPWERARLISDAARVQYPTTTARFSSLAEVGLFEIGGRWVVNLVDCERG